MAPVEFSSLSGSQVAELSGPERSFDHRRGQANVSQGIEGLSDEQISAEVARGGRFAVFLYAISILTMTFYRQSDIHCIKADESTFGTARPYILLHGLVGWRGISWGFLRSHVALIYRCSGGEHVTGDVFNSHVSSPLRLRGGASASKPPLPGA